MKERRHLNGSLKIFELAKNGRSTNCIGCYLEWNSMLKVPTEHCTPIIINGIELGVCNRHNIGVIISQLGDMDDKSLGNGQKPIKRVATKGPNFRRGG